MYLNKNQLIAWIEESGQVEQAVNNVLSEHKPECHDELLTEIAYTSAECELFKGARRAASHISEPARQEVLLNMIQRHKKGFGFRNRNFFFTAWLETIKCLHEPNLSYELMYFVSFITRTYSPSSLSHLVSLVDEAWNLLDPLNKKPIPGGIKEWENTIHDLQFESFRVS